MENPFEILIERLDNIEKMLAEVLKLRNPLDENASVTNELLNIEQAAQLLSINKGTIYKFTSTRQIPHYKTGKRIYFKKDEIIEWATKRRIITIDEIEQEANNYIIKNPLNSRFRKKK